MSQPKITIPKTNLDYTLIGIGLLGLITMAIVTFMYFEQLPDTIPTHFNASGEPDSYGDKSTLWFILLVTAAIYFILLLINRAPHIVNYSVPITPENAAAQYQNLQRLNRAMGAIITLCFAYIQYAIIQMSLGNRESLGLWFALVFVGLIFAVIGFFLYRARVIQ